MKKILISLFSCCFLISCIEKQEMKQTDILSHTINERIENFKNVNKIRYEADVILLDNKEFSEKELSDLLNHKYDSIIEDKTKSFADKPNSIDIKIYESKDHLNSKMGQWIAWLSKNKNDKEAIISFKTPKTTSNNDKTLSSINEIDRKKIWNELIQIEDKARLESEKKYPVIDTKEKSYLKYDLEDELILKYKSDLLLKYNISNEDIKKISNEGLEKNWPFP